MATRTPTRAGARAAAGSRSSTKGTPLRSSVVGAQAGLARMRQEEEKAQQRKEARELAGNMPFRFFCPVGETREIIIVDDEPTFFRSEHNLKNPATNRFDLFTPCIDEVANCPVCAAHGSKPSYFAMYLTVIDLTPYTTRDGDEVEWSKKLMVLKLSMQKKLVRLYERHGTLRGMVLGMSRDNDKEASVGGSMEFIEFMEEADIETYVTEYTDKDNKVHEVIGYEPFDYEELFPDMSEEELEVLAGNGSSEDAVGSRRGTQRALGGNSRAGSKPAGRSSARRNADAADDDGDDDQPSRPARTAGRRAAAPEPARPARAAARRAAPVEEEEEPQEETTRRAGRTAARSAAAPQPARRAVRRQAADDDGDSPLPEDDAADSPQPRAARRAALRGAR